MPKRELSKCREWERERRDRLKTCFTALGRLLPCYDPSVVLSKLEILQRAAAYIEELQRKNKDLVLGDENVSSVQNDEIKQLQERVRKLVVRNEQLANLLHDAGIKVPSECGSVRTFREPLLWSNRITPARAEVLRTRHLSNKQPTVLNNGSSHQASSKRKRKLPPAATSTGTSTTAASSTSTPSAPGTKRRKIRRRKQPDSSHRGGVATVVRGAGIVLAAAAAAGVRRKKERRSAGGASRLSTSGMAAAAAAVLGPGTLILANGSVVPVVLPPPPPVQTILTQAHLVSVSGPASAPSILVMRRHQQQQQQQQRVLQPKVGGGCTRTTTVNKVPIPALASRHALTSFVQHNNKPPPTTTTPRTTTCTSASTKSTQSTAAVTAKKRARKVNAAVCNSGSGAVTSSSSAPVTSASDTRAHTAPAAAVTCPAQSQGASSAGTQHQPGRPEQTVDGDVQCSRAASPVQSAECSASVVVSSSAAAAAAGGGASVSVSYSIDSVLCSVRESSVHADPSTQSSTAVATVLAAAETTTAGATVLAVATAAATVSDGNIVTSTSSREPRSMELARCSTTATAVTSTRGPLCSSAGTIITATTTTGTTSGSGSPVNHLLGHHVTRAGPTVTTATSTSTAAVDDALSNDLFATLHVSAAAGAGGTDAAGGASVSGHAECMSPTAAFLLAFPLVSTMGGAGRVTEVLVEDTPDSRQGTPTTLLQIGGTMLLDKQHQQSAPPPATAITSSSITTTTSSSSSSSNTSGLVDTFSPFSFPTVTDKDLHYDIRPPPAISTYEHQHVNNSQLKVLGSKSCVYEQQHAKGTVSAVTVCTVHTGGSNTSSIAYNPFADLYVPPPAQASLYSASCAGATAYQTQYEPPPPPAPAAAPAPAVSTLARTKPENVHTQHGTDNKHRTKEVNAQQNQQRPPVNWMTSPDVRHQQQQQQQQQFRQPPYMQQHHSTNNSGGSGGTDFYFPPSFSNKDLDMYTSTGGGGGESNSRSRTEYGGYSTDTPEQHQQQYPWSPGKLAPLHHPLPTLVGDLALGHSTVTESGKRGGGKEPTDTPSNNFLSVSQLVEPGLGKGHSGDQAVQQRHNKKHTAAAGGSRAGGGGVQRRAHRDKGTGRHTEPYQQRTGYTAEALLATSHNHQQHQQQYMYEQYLPGEPSTPQYTQQQQQQSQQQHHQQQQHQLHYQQHQQYGGNTSSNGGGAGGGVTNQHRQQLPMFSSAGGGTTAAAPGYVPPPPTLLPPPAPPPPAPPELAGADYTALLTDTFANFTSHHPAKPPPAFDSFSSPSIITAPSSSGSAAAGGGSRLTSRHRSSMLDGSEERRRTASKRNTSSSNGGTRHHSTSTGNSTASASNSSRSADPPPVAATGGFTELGFLSMSAAAAATLGSPLLPDEFHTTHTFPLSTPTPTAASQLYQQNPLYPRHTFVPQPDLRNNNNNSSSSTTTGANTLTNFNLTTIFPEMNKNVPVPSSRSSRTSQQQHRHHHHPQQQQNHQPQQSRHHNQHQQQQPHGTMTSGYGDRLLQSHGQHTQHHHQQQQQQQQQSHNTSLYQYPGAT